MNVSPQLLEYISNSLSQGISKDQIIQSLLDVGWNKDIIDNAFDELNSKDIISTKENISTEKTDNDNNTNSESITKTSSINDQLKQGDNKFSTSDINEKNENNNLNENSALNDTKEDYSALKNELEKATNTGLNKEDNEITNSVNNNASNEDNTTELESNTNINSSKEGGVNQLNNNLTTGSKNNSTEALTNFSSSNASKDNSTESLTKFASSESKENTIDNSNNIQNGKTESNNYSALKNQLENATIGTLKSTNTVNDKSIGPVINTNSIKNPQKEISKTNDKKNIKKFALIGSLIGIILIIIILVGIYIYSNIGNSQITLQEETGQLQNQENQQQIQQKQEVAIDSNYLLVFTTTQEYNLDINKTDIDSLNQDTETENTNNLDNEDTLQSDNTNTLNNNDTENTNNLDTEDNQDQIIQENVTDVLGTIKKREDINEINKELLEDNTNTNELLVDNNDTSNTKIGSVLSAQNDNLKIENFIAQNTQETLNTDNMINNINIEEDYNYQSENQMDLIFYDLKNQENIEISEVIKRDNNYLYSIGQWSTDNRYLPIMGMSYDTTLQSEMVNVYLYDSHTNETSKIFQEQYNTNQSIIRNFGFNFNARWISEDSFKIVPDQEVSISSKLVTSINTIGEVQQNEENKVQVISIDNISFKYNENTKGIEGKITFNETPIDYTTTENEYLLGSSDENIILLNKGLNNTQNTIVVIDPDTNIVTRYPIIIDNWTFVSAQYNTNTTDIIIHLVDSISNKTKDRFMTLDITNGNFNTLFEQNNSYLEYSDTNQEFYSPYSTFELAGENNYIVSKRTYSTIITQGVDIYAKNILDNSELEICNIVCNGYKVL